MGSQIKTEADARATIPLRPAQEQKATGQKRSKARGVATRSKKNPGKRSHQGGS
ncbi:hypothetical protein [Azohydromonas australica]|uniref:hypothetical protein n=1 Tax=Azohydromonas australica TaxID=364039 RepID=UPI000425ED1E|nr:hypothetical protein [Azohydromonas australica]